MRATLPLLLLPLFAGCPRDRGDGASVRDNPRRLITETPSDDGLVRQEVDLDGNGTPEVINYQRPRTGTAPLIVRKEMDLNRDGNIDARSFFDEDAKLVREEFDGDFDGTFDIVDHYQDGRRVLNEVDTDYDGQTNIWSYYDSDSISRQERDDNGDGLVDYWLRFDDEGNVIRTARDLDGDGKMDVRDE